ncbi:MAG: hypothetical protein M5U32_04480 [Myxococcota bacterium]|nr:hypothetical protein [Myxococcota bacterium]
MTDCVRIGLDLVWAGWIETNLAGSGWIWLDLAGSGSCWRAWTRVDVR